MKNFFRFLMAAAVLLSAASCVKEDTSTSVDGEETIEVFFATNISNQGTRTYDDGSNVDKLYYFVCDDSENPIILDKLCGTCNEKKVDANGNVSFHFSLSLIKSMTYNIYFWAQNSEAPYSIENGVVSINYANNAVAANNGNLDAFYGAVTLAANEHGGTRTVQLTRPFAQLNALTSDAQVLIDSDVDENFANVTSSVAVKGVYSQFSLISGDVAGNQQTVTFASSKIPAGYNDVVTLKENHTYLSMNYLFVPESCVADVQFTFTATRTNGSTIEVPTPEYTSVPLKPNFRTNILGALLTNPTAFNVEVEAGYDGTKERNVVSVATATELSDAINAINDASAEEGKPTEVVLECNIDFNNSTSRANVDSFLTINKDKEMILNLNGCTITGTDNGTPSFGLIVNKGKLTINDSKGNGKILLTATQNRGWNAYSSVISNSTGVLVVNGGTIEHLGGTDMAYGIDNLSGSLAAEATINGGTVKSTYRAIRQFTNSTTAENILTINGGTIEGANKSIWMQDPNKNANKGTLTVAAKAQLKGDVYLSVTAGSTEWPVSVSIAEAALAEGYTVTYGNVPGLYEVKVVDGAWTVTKITFDETFADNSWENIALACQLNAVPETWNVGDRKAMTIGGAEYQIAIIGKNHDTYTAGGTAPLTFKLADKVYGSAVMNATQTNTTGWSGSKMRTETMAEILNAMPAEVKNAIKEVNKETLNGTRDGLETTSDKLFLLSEIEVNGSVFFSNNFAEGSRYAYYTDLNSMAMNATYWLRGPGKSNAIGFTQINQSGYMANGSAEYACGVVFGFCF